MGVSDLERNSREIKSLKKKVAALEKEGKEFVWGGIRVYGGIIPLALIVLWVIAMGKR